MSTESSRQHAEAEQRERAATLKKLVFPMPEGVSRERIDQTTREIRSKIIDRLTNLIDKYPLPERALSGDELLEAAKLFDDLGVMAKRLIELRELDASVERVFEIERANSKISELLVRALQLRDEKAWMEAIFGLANVSLVNYLKMSAVANGLDPTPFTLCQENLNLKTLAEAVALAERLKLMAQLGREERKRSGRNASGEKWRIAQKRMLALLSQGSLPHSLRQAAKLLESEGFKYNTVHTAVHQSPTLKAHMNLKDSASTKTGISGGILDELASQADTKTRLLIEKMTPAQRQEAEAALQEMPSENHLELIQTLASNPDSGSCGHCPIDSDEQDPSSNDYVPRGARRRERGYADYDDNDGWNQRG